MALSDVLLNSFSLVSLLLSLQSGSACISQCDAVLQAVDAGVRHTESHCSTDITTTRKVITCGRGGKRREICLLLYIYSVIHVLQHVQMLMTKQ